MAKQTRAKRTNFTTKDYSNPQKPSREKNIVIKKYQIKIPFTEKIQEHPNMLKMFLIQDHNYAPGLQINGVKWQKDYREYLLNILNEEEKIELIDVRIIIEIPWVIVKYDIEDNHGTQEVRLSQPPTMGGVVGKDNDLILEKVDYCINYLHADTVKIFPKGQFSIRFVVWKDNNTVVGNADGSITFKYRYLDDNGKFSKKSLGFPIKFKDKINHETLFVDKDNPILPGQNFEGHYIVRLKRGMLWFNKDGSVTYNENASVK